MTDLRRRRTDAGLRLRRRRGGSAAAGQCGRRPPKRRCSTCAQGCRLRCGTWRWRSPGLCQPARAGVSRGAGAEPGRSAIPGARRSAPARRWAWRRRGRWKAGWHGCWIGSGPGGPDWLADDDVASAAVPEFDEVAPKTTSGGFTAAKSYAWRREAEASSHGVLAHIEREIAAKRRELRAADEERAFVASDRFDSALRARAALANAMMTGGTPMRRDPGWRTTPSSPSRSRGATGSRVQRRALMPWKRSTMI